jgi:diguanylate cyclase (GGDEF)-like protein
MTASDTATPALPRPKILVVDDTPANLVAMRHLLARTHAELVTVDSGNEALAACLEHDFALILLDVQMPGMDGFEVAEILSGEEATRDVPIIFVTAAFSDDFNRLRGYRSGAVDYIAKPIDDFILRSKVQVFLDLHQTRLRLERTLEDIFALNRRLADESAERERLAALARHQAQHDALTGLPNRRQFMAALEARLADAQALTLIYVDIDGFKPVNDTWGHPAGDALLVAIAGRLQGAIRDSDLCARLGGDEFALLIGGGEGEHILALADKLLAVLARPFQLDRVGGAAITVEVGGSLGIAHAPRHGSDLETLVHAADAALYAAKRAGKRRYVVAD